MKPTLQSHLFFSKTPKSLCPFLYLAVLFLTVSVSEASWPTELYTGKPLVVDTTADEEAVAVAQAPDGTLRLLTRNWIDQPSYYFGLEYSLYALDREGNLLWEPSEEQKYFIEKVLDPYTYYPVIMKTGPNGETWIVWESYVNSLTEPNSLYPSNNSIRAVRFDSDGNQSPEDFIAVAQGPENMLLHPRHVEVLDDGGVILLWEVDRNLGDGAIPYEVRAQKFDSAGNEVWTVGGVILNSTYSYYERRYTSGPAASDGAGGLLLALGNEFQRLNGDGELAWTRGRLVEAAIDSNDRTTLMEIEPGRCLVIGLNERPNLTNPSSSIIIEFDTSGTKPQEFRRLNDQTIVRYGPVRTGNNEYIIFFGNKYLVRLYSGLIDTVYDIRNGFWEEGNYTGRGSINKDGLRVEYQLTDTQYLYHIAAFNPAFELVWEHQITPVETTHSYATIPWLAPDGTTFIFWSEPGLKEGKRDIYANVVDLAGDWGVLETTSVPDRTITLLPNTITLTAWPNPTNSRVTFNTTFEKPTRVLLYTITGREVWRGTLQPGNQGTIPLDRYPSGVYLLTLPDAGVRQRVTLMK